MANTKPSPTSVSVEDLDLLCEFAKRSGRAALADAIKLFYHSRSTRESLRTQVRVRADAEGETEWTEVDYKEYPRFPTVSLPDPASNDLSLSVARSVRQSCRRFGRRPIALGDIAKALRFALADRAGFAYPSRAFPSAGGLYCTETYLIVGRVEGLSPGVYHYSPRDHCLHVLAERSDAWGRARESLAQQIGTPAAFFVESARLDPIIDKYGLRGIRFALMEIGAAAEAFELTATALGLATLWLGGFADEDLWAVLGVSPLHELEVPLLIVALGYAPLQRAAPHKT